MVKIVSVSRQKWIYVLFCFCWNARLANGKLWDGAGAEMSAGLRSRFHFPHYLRLCQVTGETLGGCQCGCVCVCCGGGWGRGVSWDVLKPLLWVSWNLFHQKPEVRIYVVCLPTEL